VSAVTVSSNILAEADVRNLTEPGKRRQAHLRAQRRHDRSGDSRAGRSCGSANGPFQGPRKTVPALPQSQGARRLHLGPGKNHPAETKHGSAVGHLLRRLHSIACTPAREHAACPAALEVHLPVEFKEPDTVGLSGSMPAKGSGTRQLRNHVTEKRSKARR